MVDTRRSRTEIATLLADNGAGAISAQDLRDAFETMQSDHGEIAIDTPVETVITDSVTFFEAAGTYSASGYEDDWDMDVNGRLRYTGAPDRMVHVAASWSLTVDGNNKTMHVGICKNGAIVSRSVAQRKISAGADVGAGGCHALTSVSTGDYLSLGIKNVTDDTNATLLTASLLATGKAQ